MILFLIAAWIIGAAAMIFFIEWKEDKLSAILLLVVSYGLFYLIPAKMRTDDISMLLAVILLGASMITHLFLYSFKGRKLLYYAYAIVFLGTIAVVNMM